MSSTPDPYVSLATVFFLGTVGVALAVQYYFTRRIFKSTPIITHAFVAFGVFICFLPFPLLALDVDSALSARDAAIASYTSAAGTPPATTPPFKSTADSWIFAWWMTIFFSTQILGWGFLPIMQSFDESGEFHWKTKLTWSIKENLRLYIILGVVAVILMGYLVFLKGVHDFQGILSLCIAAANAFGLTVLVIFLGAGAFGLPKRIWKLSDPVGLLTEAYISVKVLTDDLESARLDLQQLRGELGKMDPTVSDADRPFFVIMLETISDTQTKYGGSGAGAAAASNAVRDDKVKEYSSLASINMELRRLRKLIRRLYTQQQSEIHSCTHLSQVSGGLGGGAAGWYWLIGRKPLFRVLSIAAFLLSIFILINEILVPFNHINNTRLSLLQILIINRATRFVSAVVVLFYVASCAFWSTTKFKVFDVYALVPGVTDAASLCFFATFLTRLIMPLCYNFLLMSDVVGPEYGVTYSRAFGAMNVVDLLGTWFNKLLPLGIPVVAILIELGIIHRILAWAGFESFEQSEDGKLLLQQHCEEGRTIVARETHSTELRSVSVTGGPATTAGGVMTSIGQAVTSVLPGAAPVDPKQEAAEKAKRYAEWKKKKQEAQELDA